MYKITKPLLERYAKRVGAEIISISEQKISKTYPHYEKFIIREFLKDFDRVLFLDADTIIRHDCPNLFEMVPESALGMYDEGLLTNPEEKAVHKETMKLAFSQHCDIDLPEDWNGRFYNTGVILASKQHQDLFIPPRFESFDNYWDQSYFNTILIQKKPEIFDIGYKFNRMKYVDPKLSEHRLRSYIIHYAGILNAGPIMTKDIELWNAFELNPKLFDLLRVHILTH